MRPQEASTVPDELSSHRTTTRTTSEAPHLGGDNPRAHPWAGVMVDDGATPYGEDVLAELFRPWRTASMWRAIVHLVIGGVTAVVMFVPIISLASTALSTLVIVPVALAVAWGMVLVAKYLAVVERSRFAALLNIELIDRSTRPDSPNWWRRQWQVLRTPERWREVAYSLLHFPVATLWSVITIILWSGALMLFTLPTWVSALPRNRAEFGLFEVPFGSGALGLSLIGLALLAVVAPWSTLGLARLDGSMARWLLGRTQQAEMDERVGQLETRRAAAIDSAETERRRIERDLHDGAQQRLIAVAMDLGLARTQMTQDPARAAELVATAHDDVKAALKELRDLVRGIHPVILEDRGLDAALSAVVARAVVPVQLRVDVPLRPPASVESAAYFIVSEALVNVDRHAGARSAVVEITRHRDRLTIAVTDDGMGGADPTGGTGLAGLAERVAGLDGWMQVISPPGGPTTVLVEVPCGS